MVPLGIWFPICLSETACRAEVSAEQLSPSRKMSVAQYPEVNIQGPSLEIWVLLSPLLSPEQR